MTTSTATRSFEQNRARLQHAEKLLATEGDAASLPHYTELAGLPETAGIAHFRLGEIHNRAGRVKEARRHHERAFEVDPILAGRITPEQHPHHGYVFRRVKEVAVENCPLCGQTGQDHWVFDMVTNPDFNPGFHPIRTWRRCDGCHHLYADARPADLGAVLRESDNEQYAAPALNLLPYYGDVLARLRDRAGGRRLLEVGVGGGEMILAARECGFDAMGLEIRPSHATRVHQLTGLEVRCADFLEFHDDASFDVICMGDVLEHMLDPVAALARVHALLRRGGVVWISTPNFDSAFSRLSGDRDPMKRVCEHLNYFSERSLEQIMAAQGLQTVDYRISAHYNGSMEVVGLKV